MCTKFCSSFRLIRLKVQRHLNSVQFHFARSFNFIFSTMSHNFRISIADSNRELIFQFLQFLSAFFSKKSVKNVLFYNQKLVATLTLGQSNWVAQTHGRKDYTSTKPFLKPVSAFKKCFCSIPIECDFIFRIRTVQLHRYHSQWNHYHCGHK